MRYSLVIFDLDGTILDTLEDLSDSLNASLERFGYPRRTLAEAREFVGNGIRRLIERAVPEGTTREETDQVHRYFMDHYQRHCMDKTKPYEGISDAIVRLRCGGCRTAVVSNKADSAVRTLADRYFEGMFDIVVGEREGVSRKPSPDAVNEIRDHLGISCAQTVYIGDSEVDIATAHNAGVDSILVGWGFRGAGFLREQGARTVIQDPSQIPGLVL